MKRKRLALAAALLLGLAAALFVGSGYITRDDVVLHDYSLSEDGTELTLSAGLSGSMGYIRGFRAARDGDGDLRLSFYSAFGGFNSSLGARSEFSLALEEGDREIYFSRPDGGYELILLKDGQTGQWQRR